MKTEPLKSFFYENFNENSSFYKDLLKYYIHKETKEILQLKEHISNGLVLSHSIYLHNNKIRYNWKKILLSSAKKNCEKTLNIFIGKQHDKLNSVIGNNNILKISITGDSIKDINFHVELENKTKFTMNSKLILVNEVDFPFKRYPSIFINIEHDQIFYKRQSFGWLKKALSK